MNWKSACVLAIETLALPFESLRVKPLAGKNFLSFQFGNMWFLVYSSSHYDFVKILGVRPFYFHNPLVSFIVSSDDSDRSSQPKSLSQVKVLHIALYVSLNIL